jgi:hypothetical protein
VDKDGKKKRINNDQAYKCSIVPKCEPCDDNLSFPCKKQKATFTSKKQFNQYCKLLKAKPSGEYTKSERSKIAKKANKALKRVKYVRKSKRKVTFAV